MPLLIFGNSTSGGGESSLLLADGYFASPNLADVEMEMGIVTEANGWTDVEFKKAFSSPPKVLAFRSDGTYVNTLNVTGLSMQVEDNCTYLAVYDGGAMT